MPIEICNQTRLKLSELAERIAKDGAQIMKEKAPTPRSVHTGLGSESTGALKKSIQYWKVPSKDDTWIYVVGPHSGKYRKQFLPSGEHQRSDRVGDYAYYANYGRGPITTHDHPMVFYPKHPKTKVPVITNHVDAMEGWHFVEKTKKILEDRINDGYYND